MLMEGDSVPNIPSVKMCGISIPLVAVNLPNTVAIHHPISEAHKIFTSIEDRKAGDISIKIGETILHAHKDLLISKIPFFRDLFNSNLTECASGEINLSSKFCEFNLSTLETLLDYAYTGYLTISTDNVQDLMLGASFLRIDSVMDECSAFMKKRVTVDNIFSLLNFCRSIAYERINSDIHKFIDKNFVYLSRTAEFLEMIFEDLLFFLKRDTLYIDDENQIFESVSRWIKYDTERWQYAARLLENIRCNLLSVDFITDTVEKTDWVMSNPDCVALLGKAKDKTIHVHSKRICEDRHVLFFGYRPAEHSPNHVFSFQLYDPITNSWTSSKRNRTSNHFFDGTLSDGHKIFVRRAISNDIPEPGDEWLEMYDALTDEWFTDRKAIEKNLSKFPEYIRTVRDACTLGIIDGKVYMAGGRRNDNTRLSSLEVFDDTSKVFGGGDEFGNTLKCGECYDPQANRWHTISSMTYQRGCFRSVVFKNQIYVFGGSDAEQDFYTTVERYNPVTNSWTTLKSMIHKRAHPFADVSCGKIFVFGGVDCWKPHHRINTVEMYDPETNTWEERHQMAYPYVCIPLPVPASYPSPVANLEARINFWISEFRNFSLKEKLLKAIVECGFMYPTKVQLESISQAITGKNYICEIDAKGKTSSFVISTLQQLEPIEGRISVLILVPSRELASNIHKEYERFSKYLEPIKIAAFFGGVPIKKNKEYLENNCPHIVVGTPIRILDLIQPGSLNIGDIKNFVLDECDQLMGNRDMCNSVMKIFNFTSTSMQILSFDVLNKKTKKKLLTIYENRI